MQPNAAPARQTSAIQTSKDGTLSISAVSSSLGWGVRDSRARVGLVDQTHHPCAIMHTDGRRPTALPMVKGIAQYQGIGCRKASFVKNLVALCSGEFQDTVLHCEDGVAPVNFPLTIGAIPGKTISDLDGAEDPARGAKNDGGIVLDGLCVHAPAQLRAGHLRLLAGQVEEHVKPVRAQVAQA